MTNALDFGVPVNLTLHTNGGPPIVLRGARFADEQHTAGSGSHLHADSCKPAIRRTTFEVQCQAVLRGKKARDVIRAFESPIDARARSKRNAAWRKTCGRNVDRTAARSRENWLVRHYDESVAFRLNMPIEQLNRPARRRLVRQNGGTWSETTGQAAALETLRAAAAPVALPDPLAEDHREMLWSEYYAASQDRNRRKARRRFVRAAGGQA